ncbi:MAG: ABC transporter permease, partial [Bryobacteraceae bacterium]
VRWVDQLVRDLCIALRTLRRSPGFTAAAVGVLALTIGSAAAMFTFVDAILLRPLPYHDPDRVVMIWETHKNAPPRSSTTAPWADPRQTMVSAANLADWNREQRVFETIEPVAFGWFNVQSTEQVMGGRAGAGFFKMLGAGAALGRTFGPGDEGQPVVVLTHGLWSRRFGADPAIIGQSIRLSDSSSYTVIGILRRDFFFYLDDFELWVPLELAKGGNRTRRSLLAAARLAPSISLEEAETAMDGIAAHLAQARPETNRDWGVSIIPVKEQFTSFMGPIVLALFAAVLILLLMGGVNALSLSLARMQARQREMSIRMALGASRRHMFQFLWAESLVIAACGSGIGLFLAWAAVPYLISLLPLKMPIPMPGLATASLGWRAALFAGALSLVISMLIAGLPRKETSGSGGKQMRFFHGLIAVQTALAVLLLAGAGVTVKSLWRLFQVDQGFDRSGVLTFRTPLSRIRYPGESDRVRVYG